MRDPIMTEKKKKVIFCCPTIKKPFQPFLDSLAASIPLIVEAGWDEGSVYTVANPYISCARASMLRKALDAKADVIVFLDHDLSWEPGDLLKLIETRGDMVAGTYRFKKPEEEYMGQLLAGINSRPVIRDDGALKGFCAPAGFLKITKEAVNKLMKAYPELVYGELYAPHIDLFNHGAHKGIWYGEDYALSRRWLEMGEELWIVPTLKINHHTEQDEFKGNFHMFLGRQPGGALDPNRGENKA